MITKTTAPRPDVTGEQRAVETLRLSDARYRRLFETAQDGILILNAETGTGGGPPILF
ncbi:MAG: hypothetical protein WDN28_28050 [Chthoniobacter sp.]